MNLMYTRKWMKAGAALCNSLTVRMAGIQLPLCVRRLAGVDGVSDVPWLQGSMRLCWSCGCLHVCREYRSCVQDLDVDQNAAAAEDAPNPQAN